MLELDMSPLEKAVAELDMFLAQVEKQKDDPAKTSISRMASIKAFDRAYELSHKALRRFFKLTEPSAQVVEELSFQGLIRLALVRGLVRGEVKEWLA